MKKIVGSVLIAAMFAMFIGCVQPTGGGTTSSSGSSSSGSTTTAASLIGKTFKLTTFTCDGIANSDETGFIKITSSTELKLTRNGKITTVKYTTNTSNLTASISYLTASISYNGYDITYKFSSDLTSFIGSYGNYCEEWEIPTDLGSGSSGSDSSSSDDTSLASLVGKTFTLTKFTWNGEAISGQTGSVTITSSTELSLTRNGETHIITYKANTSNNTASISYNGYDITYKFASDLKSFTGSYSETLYGYTFNYYEEWTLKE